MFGNKKDTRTVEEIKRDELLDRLRRTRDYLGAKAVSSYVKNSSLCCYIPNSPDYEHACEDLAEEQRKVRNLIAEYDTLRAEIISKYPIFKPIQSHDVIELSIRRLFKD